MVSNKKKKRGNQADDRTEVHVEEFIPYTCHFDKNTLLTKNGELLQVLKITGFNFESVKNEKSELLLLRDAIRHAVSKNIKTNNFALWFHTMRRQKDISTDGEYTEGFCKDLNDAWCKRHDWEHKFVNELYVTIMIEGQDLSAKDLKTFFRSMYFPVEFKHRRAFLENACTELTNLTDGLLKTLGAYGAKKLEVIKIDGIYHSELTGFLGKIINLKEAPAPLAMVDLSEVLPTHKLSFGFDIFEVRGATGRHFGSILTIKEYHELSTRAIDKFLQLPIQYIITETFDFVSRNKALSHFAEQSKLQGVIDDKELSQASGLHKILESDKGNPTDFGEHQINIMVIGHSIKNLNDSVRTAVRTLLGLGIIVIKEDVFMEDCYWSQLPGNFDYLRRMKPINAPSMAGYASLYNFPAGRIENNYWGPAVTVFHTKAGTPYFFNFHYGDNGHTSIVGPFGAGKTVLMNFLVSSAQKFKNKLFFFDQNRSSEIFLRSIGAKYKKLDFQRVNNEIHFNPLKLAESNDNILFLEKWLELLITLGLSDITESERIKTKEAVKYNYSLPKDERKLSNVIPKFWPLSENLIIKEEDDDLGGFSSMSSSVLKQSNEKTKEGPQPSEAEKNLSLWYGKGYNSAIFDNDTDDFILFDNLLHGFDMTEVAKKKESTAPIIFYMYHCIHETLSNYPTIIVFDEAWSLLDSPAIAKELESWLDNLRAKNTIAIFATESVDKAEKSSITSTLTKKIETKIFLPNSNATNAYVKVFGLSNNEFKLLKSINPNNREFLLKHNVDAVIAQLNLEELDFELSILASKQETLAIMDGSIKDMGSDTEKWLPLYKKRFSA